VTQPRVRSWRAEYAPGRVFELKRKTYKGPPVCALAIQKADRELCFNTTDFVQVDEHGCTEGTYGRAQSRFWVGSISASRMTGSLIARRRPDLERFDAEDLALIRYGQRLDFGGRFKTSLTKDSIPPIPGKVWTVFWTKDDRRLSWLSYAERELAALLRGHWHIYSRCGGDWTFGRDSHLAAWATVDTDPVRLRRIEWHLRQHLPHLEVQRIEMVAIPDGDRMVVRAHGQPCPAIRSRGTTTIWPDGRFGFSISSDDCD
jgi:hypothetical protein